MKIIGHELIGSSVHTMSFVSLPPDESMQLQADMAFNNIKKIFLNKIKTAEFICNLEKSNKIKTPKSCATKRQRNYECVKKVTALTRLNVRTDLLKVNNDAALTLLCN